MSEWVAVDIEKSVCLPYRRKEAAKGSERGMVLAVGDEDDERERGDGASKEWRHPYIAKPMT